MSADLEAEADMCCASCGVAEVDDIKLKICNACDLVRYCSDTCQQEHRTQHKATCKERAAELRDEILFRQPESSHLGDCPICFLPLPIYLDKLIKQHCCSKIICRGCHYAIHLREMEERRLDRKCIFCRQSMPDTIKLKTVEAWTRTRVEANDPVAVCDMGTERYHEGDYESAFKYWTKAVELDSMEAHYQLSCVYRKGNGVEKDEKKVWYHLEEAAIGGHVEARYNLAVYELRNDKVDRAVKHFIIAANLGHDKLIQLLMDCYKGEFVSKEDLAAALRAHQAAADAMKSPQRDTAAALWAQYG